MSNVVETPSLRASVYTVTVTVHSPSDVGVPLITQLPSLLCLTSDSPAGRFFTFTVGRQPASIESGTFRYLPDPTATKSVSGSTVSFCAAELVFARNLAYTVAPPEGTVYLYVVSCHSPGSGFFIFSSEYQPQNA